ncbi:hypothetical protein [Variovorax sp. GT1P44]|uniref:hypothetical protein n=1 Tax=Variovorax sp. GT1P44 TaxID=3443742 RepID=UPI003F47D096
MNAKLLLGVSALALAGAVSAQTVPAELWVGAPIPMTGQLSRAQVSADLAANRMEMNAVAAEYRVGPPDSIIGALSRAEVAADLSLWNKSGMAQVANRDSFDPTSASYARQFSSYQSMRNGPEFVTEIQRIKGMTPSSTTASFGSGSTAN